MKRQLTAILTCVLMLCAQVDAVAMAMACERGGDAVAMAAVASPASGGHAGHHMSAGDTDRMSSQMNAGDMPCCHHDGGAPCSMAACLAPALPVSELSTWSQRPTGTDFVYIEHCHENDSGPPFRPPIPA